MRTSIPFPKLSLESTALAEGRPYRCALQQTRSLCVSGFARRSPGTRRTLKAPRTLAQQLIAPGARLAGARAAALGSSESCCGQKPCPRRSCQGQWGCRCQAPRGVTRGVTRGALGEPGSAKPAMPLSLEHLPGRGAGAVCRAARVGAGALLGFSLVTLRQSWFCRRAALVAVTGGWCRRKGSACSCRGSSGLHLQRLSLPPRCLTQSSPRPGQPSAVSSSSALC